MANLISSPFLQHATLVRRMHVRLLLLVLLARGRTGSILFVRIEQVDGMVSTLSEITGWKVKKKVPSEMLGKDSFRRFVESRMKEVSSEKQVRAEELTLKNVRLRPPRTSISARETVDLVSEQAAAFYDYNKKRLFILDSTTEGTEQQVALVHELAHALADQQSSTREYLHAARRMMTPPPARQAVMEDRRPGAQLGLCVEAQWR